MCYQLRFIAVLITAVLANFSLLAQAGSPDNATLREQFDAMVRGSNRYQQFRVVPQTELDAYIAAVTDTLRQRSAETAALDSTIAAQSESIEQLENTVATLQEDIAVLQEEKDGIYLLGFLVSKVTYNLVLWSLIVAAIAGLTFFYLRAKYAVSITRGLQNDKEELSDKLARAKKRRLEVEQDLRRKLQDEINRREQLRR